jgi:5'-nucleotidase
MDQNSEKHYKHLTLLHSNDMHGDFLAEDVDANLVGGVSLLSGYINKVRAEEPNTLYCIAGDMFRGSIIDAEFQGISTIEIMNMLSPDVVTLGNHETDYGVAHLLFLEKCATFPIINANLHIRTNHARLFNPYLIKEIDGMKILFIGILTEEVMAQTKNDGLVGSIVDVEEAAQEVGKICNTYNSIDIDFTVLLTHIGFEEDKKLAARLDPAWGVDVIIGGHSHTFIKEPAKVNDILIVQAGTGTDQIGRFDITIDTDENCVAEYQWRSVPINSENCPRDEEIESLITQYKSRTDAKYSRVITRFSRKLTHPVRTQETELGSIFSDALRNSLGLDIMLLGSGSIRSDDMGPIVMLTDLMVGFPYDDKVYLLKVSGRQLKQMILYMVRDEVWAGVHSEFYQLSEGLHVVYSRADHEFREFTYQGERVDDDWIFTLGLQEYHYNNFEDIFQVSLEEVKKNGAPRVICTSCRSVIEEYLTAHQHLDHQVGERLVIL